MSERILFRARVGERTLFIEYDLHKWRDPRYLKVHVYAVADQAYSAVTLSTEERAFVEQLIGEHVRTGTVTERFRVTP